MTRRLRLAKFQPPLRRASISIHVGNPLTRHGKTLRRAFVTLPEEFKRLTIGLQEFETPLKKLLLRRNYFFSRFSFIDHPFLEMIERFRGHLAFLKGGFGGSAARKVHGKFTETFGIVDSTNFTLLPPTIVCAFSSSRATTFGICPGAYLHLD